MAGFNPAEYDMVEVRVKRFHEENKDGRIITDLVPDNEEWIFRTEIFLSAGDQAAGLPKSVGWATEKKGSSQFAAELTETSSVGRCLANMALHGSKRASREEMRKVNVPNRDYIAEAKKTKDADTLRLLWTEAKAAGSSQKILDEVKAHAERLDDSAGKRPGGSASVSGSGKQK